MNRRTNALSFALNSCLSRTTASRGRRTGSAPTSKHPRDPCPRPPPGPRHPLLCPFMGLRFCPHFFLGECRDSSKTHLGARVLRSQTFRSSQSDSTSCSRHTSGTPFLLCPLADSYWSSTSLSQLGFPCSLAQVKSLRPMPIPGSLSSFSPYFSHLLTLRRHPALRPRGIPLLWGKDWRMGTAPVGRPAVGRTAATRGLTR